MGGNVVSVQGFEPALLRERLAILGRSGQGKSNAAKTGVEELLRRGGRVLVLDPTDVWHGLRLTREKKPAFDVAIFGGRYADLPLNPRAGSTIGEAIARGNTSCIVSLRDLDEDELPDFAADLFSALYLHNREPLTMVVDEADLFAPEQPTNKAQHRSRKNLRRIIKQGRVDGFRPWLITQRPQELDKAALSQSDAMVAFSLTSSHDRDAVKAWIKGQGDSKEREAEFVAGLPKLKRGHALIWWPAGDVLGERHFPLASTYDTGKAPDDGKTRRVLNLKPIDVAKLGADMTAFAAEKEANDPARLREENHRLKLQVADLIRDVDRAKSAAADPEELERAKRAGRASGRVYGYSECQKEAGEQMLAMQNALSESVAHARAAMLEKHKALIELATSEPTPPPVAPRDIALTTTTTPQHAYRAGMQTVRRPQPDDAAHGRRRDLPVNGLEKGPRAILTALAQISRRFGPSVIDPARVSHMSGYSVASSTFRIYVGKLVAAGYVTKHSPDGLQITPDGDRAAGDVPPLPEGPAIVSYWINSLPAGPSAMLAEIARRGGLATPAEVSEGTGYSLTSSTFRIYAGKLRQLKIIGADKGEFRLHESMK